MDHPDGPWRRSVVQQIIDTAREVGELELVLRALLDEADDAQLHLLWLALSARQRRQWQEAYDRATRLVQDVYRPREQ